MRNYRQWPVVSLKMKIGSLHQSKEHLNCLPLWKFQLSFIGLLNLLWWRSISLAIETLPPPPKISNSFLGGDGGFNIFFKGLNNKGSQVIVSNCIHRAHEELQTSLLIQIHQEWNKTQHFWSLLRLVDMMTCLK